LFSAEKVSDVLLNSFTIHVLVVDTGNYYPRQRDGRIDGIEAGMLETRWVEQQLYRPPISMQQASARH
jgi:hypothetical protein